MFTVYVRAKTANGRWANVKLEDLDERSFRKLIGDCLVRTKALTGIDDDDTDYTTPLTKAEVDAR